MSRLPLRSRLFLALATVALLPVLVFGVVAVELATSGAAQQQQSAALRLAQLAATGLPRQQLPDAAAAGRLAALTGGSVTIFDQGGVARAQAGDAAIATLPPFPSSASGGIAMQTGSRIVAVVPLQGAAGQPIGYLALSQPLAGSPDVGVVLAVALTVTVLWGVFLSFALARVLIHPMRELTATLDRLQAGDLSARIVAPADDELGRLAESHNRLAAALAARNESLHQVLEALAALSPRDGIAPLLATAEGAATTAFGFRSAEIVLAGEGRQDAPEPGERVPGEAWTVIAPLRLGDDQVGWLRAVVPPQRDWGPADTDLLALFGSQLAAAVRNAELYAEVSSLSELKSEFLRGVSHNLQTPLTSIRAFAERLATHNHDPGLRIIIEQADRLSRLVAQLLTVSRLEAGTLRPQEEVVALAPLVRRAWESLGHDEVPFTLRDEAAGWLAVADRDWLDQVVWALLDNAVKHGGGAPVEVAIREERTTEPGGRAGGGQSRDAAADGRAGPPIDQGAGPDGRDAAADGRAGPAIDQGAGPDGRGHRAGAEPIMSTSDGTARDRGRPSGARLVVTVRDHGPGIADAMRDRIFERFATGGSTGGTGLGLSVAHGLVQAMGGSIWVADPGEGAAFVFALPAEPPDDA